MAKTKARKQRQPKEENPDQFDLNTFIKEQDIEMDDSLLKLMDENPPKKQKKKEEEPEIVEEQEEDDEELAAFVRDELIVKEYENRTEAILERLGDISNDVDFVETLAIVSERKEVDATNDLEREMAFYEQALDSVKRGIEQMHKLGIKTERPQDYFAEMVKSDEHMQRIRERLIKDKEEVQRQEEKRTQREIKKFGKKVQIEKQLERQQQKRETLEKIKKFKGDDFDVEVEDEKPQKKNFKREAKNKKFGFGGKKRFAKQNTADSTADLKSFNMKKMKGVSKKR
ncbi:eukaryotic rRNA processing protein EBP2-domain-containing protein, partial [Gorgonomyces haynaldii]